MFWFFIRLLKWFVFLTIHSIYSEKKNVIWKQNFLSQFQQWIQVRDIKRLRINYLSWSLMSLGTNILIYLTKFHVSENKYFDILGPSGLSRYSFHTPSLCLFCSSGQNLSSFLSFYSYPNSIYIFKNSWNISFVKCFGFIPQPFSTFNNVGVEQWNLWSSFNIILLHSFFILTIYLLMQHSYWVSTLRYPDKNWC